MAPLASSDNGRPKMNKLFHRNNRASYAEPPPSSFIPPAEPTTSVTKHPQGAKRLLRNPSKVLVTEKGEDDVPEPEDDVAPLSETPIIVEPPPFPIPTPTATARAGRRSMTIDRPYSMAIVPQDGNFSAPSPSTARLSEFSNRLSGWFSHSFAGSSTTDLPLSADFASASITSSPSSATVTPQVGQSPKHKASGIFNVARPAKAIGGGLDKAVRYLFDSDAQPDKCTDSIWLMGVQHPGYEPPSPKPQGHRRDSTDVGQGARRSTPPTISRGAGGFPKNPSLQSLSLSLSSSQSNPKQVLSWPPAFYEDFTSCIWMTYRSQYFPIRDITLAQLEAVADVDPTLNPQLVASPPRKWWGGEKTWSSDSGWGCMLRTGQNLLASALIRIHLGRDWRRPPSPNYTSEYATYVKLLTWFFDSPSTLCPFGVHRMALAGKDLGTDVGCWFGPSIAAGAIKQLVHAYPDAGLSVAHASNHELFESDIYAASHLNSSTSNLNSSKRSKWGGRPVLVLIGIRLGIDGVNPVYHEGIKELFTWPQSVGISGGRPSSSYYFVGQQAGSLFYLDPHHTRPSIPLRPPPSLLPTPASPAMTANSHLESAESADDRPTAMHARVPTSNVRRQITPEREAETSNKLGRIRSGSIRLKNRRVTGSPPSRGGSGSSNASVTMHTPLSPSPLGNGHSSGQSAGASGTSPSGSSFSSVVPPNVDPLTYHYATAYSPAELRTFHCDKVRKMPFSALDPSMLLGFLVKDEADWLDLRFRATEFARTHKPIFTIQDEPPSWSDPDDFESFSDPEPDMDDLDADEHSDEAPPTEDLTDDPEIESRPKRQSWHDKRDSSFASNTTESLNSDEFDDDFEQSDPPAQPNRSSTLTASTKVSSKMASTDDSHALEDDDDDDDDWDSSVPSSSSPPITSPVAKMSGPPTSQPIAIDLSPPHSRSSSSASPPTSTQYPFPRVPSPQETPPPVIARPTTRDAPGMRSLVAKDGGRTPSGGVLAVFNPQQD